MLMSHKHMSEYDSSRLQKLAWSIKPEMGDSDRKPPPPLPIELARRASERLDVPDEEFPSSAPKRRRPHSAAAEGDSSSTFRRPSSSRPPSSSASRTTASTPAAVVSTPARPTQKLPSSSPAPIRLPPFSALASGVPPYQTPRRVSSESEGGASSSAGRFAYGVRRSSSPASHSSGSSKPARSQAAVAADASVPLRNASR